MAALRDVLRKLVSRSRRRRMRCIDILDTEYGHDITRRQGRSIDRHGGPIPWYTYPALDFLGQLDFSSKSVFEFGAGNSTLYWGRSARRVVTVEHNRQWQEEIQAQFGDLPIELHHAPEEDARVYAQSIRAFGGPFDVVVVDGRHRHACAREGRDHLARGGLLILDNGDWYPKTAAMLRESGLIEVDMTGFGPINAYVWTTSLFLDREFSFPPRFERQPVIPPGSCPGYAEDDEPPADADRRRVA